VKRQEETFAAKERQCRKRREKSKKKAKEISPQMDADKRRCSETQNVFICVHLRSSVDKNVCNFL
jgi:hypothetical protein